MGEPTDFSKYIHGFYLVPILTLLGELGLADRWLAGNRVDLSAFCREQQLNAELVRHCVEYLRHKGYLTREGDFYLATESGRPVLEMWTLAMIHYAYAPLTLEFLALARNEKSYGYGKEVYREMYFDSRGSGLSGMQSGRFARVVDYLRRNELRCLLDLGCGDGHFLAYACEQFSALRAVGVDQSEVSLEQARRNFERRGMSGRAEFRQGDILRPEEFMYWAPAREVDVASIWFILHEITYQSTAPVFAFLSEFRRHFPRVPLCVTEIYRLPDADLRQYTDRAIPETTLFHDLSLQRLLPKREWLEIYEESGFRVIDTVSHLARPSVEPAMETLILLSG